MPASTSQGSTSTSPTSPRAPISPFASANSDSHYTSDDLPDLGAFNTVLREWVYLQPPLRIPNYHQQLTTSTTSEAERPDTDTEDAGRRSTVWNHEPIAHYLLDHGDDDAVSRVEAGDTDIEGARSVEIETVIDDDGDQVHRIGGTSISSLPPDSSYSLSPLRTQPSLQDSFFSQDIELEDLDMDFQPSLGYLDEALSFIAAERARHDAQRTTGVFSPDAYKHVIGARRKRRRRRPGKGAPKQDQPSETFSPAVSGSSLFNTSSDLGAEIGESNQSVKYDIHAPGVVEEDDEDDEDELAIGDEFEGEEDVALGDDEYEGAPYYPDRPSIALFSKSTPMTPKPRAHWPVAASPRGIFSSDDLGSTSASVSASMARHDMGNMEAGLKTKSSRRRSRSKHTSKHKRTLTHSRSTPSLRTLAEAQAIAPYISPNSPSLSSPLAANPLLASNLKKTQVPHIIHPQTLPLLTAVPDPHTLRLVTLTRYLSHVFPAESGLLAGVERKLVVGAARRARRGGVGAGGRGGTQKGGKSAVEAEDDIVYDREDSEWDPEMELDPRGRPPKAGDPPVHVFIDHSNILFGLLTYLKRHSSPMLRNTTARISRNASTTVTQGIYVNSTTKTNIVTTSTPIPLPSFATASHSLNLSVSPTSPSSPSKPSKGKGKGANSNITILKRSSASTISTSMPAPTIPTSVSNSSDDILLLGDTWAGVSLRDGSGHESGEGGDLQKVKNSKGRGWDEKEKDNSDADAQLPQEDNDQHDKRTEFVVEDEDDLGEKEFESVQPPTSGSGVKRKQARHLSHTALTLILERGRAVTRRVVVTSSPLYQPMDTMERLEYEVRVYLRVPDLGDGMDRREKTGQGHSKSNSMGGNTSRPAAPKKSKGHVRHLSGNTSTDSAGAGTNTSLDANVNFITTTAAEPAMVNKSTASQSIAPASSPLGPGLTLGTSPSHSHQLSAYYQLYNPHARLQGVNLTAGMGAAKVKYREQGVDELLQLKLHQALAATDNVPEGATIVLATGDGNVGQFNEDGFLGPVRTALRRGWRVELYAWEDGLSRAWRREFGAGSEWAQNGRFQIIGMEQFAASLVEGGL